MKTTINVQLGPYNFPFEMEAYEFLKQYIQKLNVAFAQEVSKDEILEDIETRIGELLQQNRTLKSFSVDLEEIQSIASIMGEFEEFSQEEKNSTGHKGQIEEDQLEGYSRRKIFRDQDDAVIGGVCSGLSYYLGWDPVVLRIVMVILLLISFGTFFMAYVIAWAVIPAAKTTTEKLLMRGNPVTLDNIQQHVKTEANKANRNVKRWGRKLEDSFNGDAGSNSVWKFFRLLAGVFLFCFGISLLFLITIFMAWSEGGDLMFLGGDIHDFTSWVAPDGIGEYMLAGIALIILSPAIGLLYTGIHYLLGLRFKRKWIYLFSTLSLIAGLLVCTYTGIRLAKDFDTQGSIARNVPLGDIKGDTLFLDIAEDPYFIGRGNDEEDVLDMVTMDGDFRVLSAAVEVRLADTDRDEFWLEVIQSARGSNLSEAGNRANQMDFRYTWVNNRLTINPYFKIPSQVPYRAQAVEVVVHVPSRKQVMLNGRWGWVSWKDDWNNMLLINEEGNFQYYY
jgi:phage shock protein PspC (stress-responsive transcriptional regulator)